MTWTEFEILALLASVPMRCFSKSTISEHLWGRDYFEDGHTIESHVSRLRKKLRDRGGEDSWIITVRKAGYRLEVDGDVEVITMPTSDHHVSMQVIRSTGVLTRVP